MRQNKGGRLQELREKEAILIAEHIVNTGATIRKAAVEFGISKSTIHKRIHKTLPMVDGNLYSLVCLYLASHLEARAGNGGRAVRKRWKCVKTRCLHVTKLYDCEKCCSKQFCIVNKL